ncbi:MAG: S8 family peptidase, partial [bacterium]
DHEDLWGLLRVGALEAWDISQGEGVVVAVVDTGLDWAHPDISDNVWVNSGEDLDGDGRYTATDRNGVDDDDNGFVDDVIGFDFANSRDIDGNDRFDDPEDESDPDPFDDNGHGTHVAGTISAVRDNGIGIVGVAPRARVMALKGFPSEGSARSSDLWRAVLYAAENGAKVVNNSWSCGDPCPVNPLAEAVLEVVEVLDVSVVTSAGNRSEDVVFRSPENTGRVIVVGSSGVDDALSGFSNRGWLMDLVAPGGGPSQPRSILSPRRNILSLRSSGTLPIQEPFFVGDLLFRLAGTSMSSPHVAGAVALLRSQRPDLTPRDVRRLLRLSAQDLGEARFDRVFGAGLLDAEALLSEPLPELHLEIDRLRPTESHDPTRGPFLLRGRAAGEDLLSVEVGVARGLAGSDFETLLDSEILRSPDGVLSSWPVEDREDGPWTFRVRAKLVDGRVVDEYSLVALERNPPLRLSSGVLDARQPSASRGIVVWQELENADGAPSHDLVRAPFPRGDPRKRPGSEPARRSFRSREPELLVGGEGDQRNPTLDGPLLVWTRVD